MHLFAELNAGILIKLAFSIFPSCARLPKLEGCHGKLPLKAITNIYSGGIALKRDISTLIYDEMRGG
jgi:hypothetical protein